MENPAHIVEVDPVLNINSHLTLSLSAIITEVLLSMATFYTFFHTFSHFLTTHSFLDRFHLATSVGLDISCKAVSAIFATSASTTGFYVLIFNPASATTNQIMEHVMCATIAYFCYDLYAMFVVNARRIAEESRSEEKNTFVDDLVAFVKSQPLLAAHHFLIGCVFTPLMMTRMDHEPGGLMLACALVFEASTPFVSLRSILSYLDMKKSFAYVINGLLMMVVFFCCRILVYPCFYQAYARQRGLTFLAAVQSTPNRCAVFMVGMLLPQLYWFRIMVRGAIKVIQEQKTEKSD